MKIRMQRLNPMVSIIAMLTIIAIVIHLFVRYQEYVKHPEYSGTFITSSLGTIILYSVVVVTSFIVFLLYKNKCVKR